MIAIAWELLKAGAGVVWAGLKAIPWQGWALLGLVAFVLWYGENCADAREELVRAEYAALADTDAAQLSDFKIEQATVSEKVVTRYVDRVKVIHEKGDTIRELVPVYVPLAELPGGFRVLHDAAAAGVVPDPAGTVDAAGTDTQAVAATVADNYGACHENTAQLTELQAWLQGRVPPL